MTSNKPDLKPEYYGGVWDIISGSNQLQIKAGELEFDIEKLPVKVARQLERYARSKLTPIKKSSKKPQPKKNPLAFHKEDLAPRSYVSQAYGVSYSDEASPASIFSSKARAYPYSCVPFGATTNDGSFQRGKRTIESQPRRFEVVLLLLR